MQALFLIDGEHYPPVVLDAMRSVRDSLGAEGVAAAFLGGTEKLKEGTDYGLPLVTDEDPASAVGKALSEYAVDVVVDLSDAHIWDASSVAVLDAVEHKYATRGKTVQITGLTDVTGHDHRRLAGQLGGGR